MSGAEQALLDHVAGRVVRVLSTLPAEECADTYVVSLYLEDGDHGPLRPTVVIGTNTESQVRFSSDPPADFVKPHEWWTPTDEVEARWNYAFWLQNRLDVVGDADDDAGSPLIEAWLRSVDGWADDPDGDDVDWEEATARWRSLASMVARRLHEDGAVAQIFGRTLPVIVHELGYYDEIAEANAIANPGGEARGLIDWIESM